MRAISYPFRISPQGSVASTRETSKIWTDRVRAVLSTQLGDRVMRPNFGINALGAVLNLNTPARDDMEAQVRSGFTNFLPTLTLESVETRSVGETTYVVVSFTCPDRSEVVTSVGFNEGVVVADTDPYEVTN